MDERNDWAMDFHALELDEDTALDGTGEMALRWDADGQCREVEFEGGLRIQL